MRCYSVKKKKKIPKISYSEIFLQVQEVPFEKESGTLSFENVSTCMCVYISI